MDPLQNTQPQQNPNALPPQEVGAPSSSSKMTPDEMRKDLKILMNSIDDKMNLFNGQKKAASNQLDKAQNDAIGQLFEVLKQNGVDPSNQDSVNAFLAQLKQSNPQGYQIFESAIESLLSQKNVLKQEQPPNGFAEPMNPMDQMMQSQPGSPADITANQMPLPSPLPDSMNQPNAQTPAPAPQV